MQTKTYFQLWRQPVSEWGRIFESSLTDGESQLGGDTNYVLLKSCFAAALERCPRPDFVLYAGDSLAHNWQAQYDKTASCSRDDDPEAYRDFTAKAITFLAMELRKHYPDVPVLPSLGNEDELPGPSLD